MKLVHLSSIPCWRPVTHHSLSLQAAHATQMGYGRMMEGSEGVKVEGFIIVAIICHICRILPPALVREHSLCFQPLLSLLITAAGRLARLPHTTATTLTHLCIWSSKDLTQSVWGWTPTWSWLTPTCAWQTSRRISLTLIGDVLCPVKRVLCGVLERGVDIQQRVVEKHRVVCGDVAAVSGVAADWHAHTLLP